VVVIQDKTPKDSQTDVNRIAAEQLVVLFKPGMSE